MMEQDCGKREDNSTKKSFNELDFESEHFDPLLVLGSPESNICIPIDHARMFDNLAQYASRTWPKNFEKREIDPIKQRQLLVREKFKQTIKNQYQEQVHKEKDMKKTNNESSTSGLNITKGDHNRSVLEFMQNPKGPMQLLKECHHMNINVLIRRKRRVYCVNEQFATIEGRLELFDRHLNLVLYDVKEIVETTRPPPTYIKYVTGDGDVQMSLQKNQIYFCRRQNEKNGKSEDEKNVIFSRKRYLKCLYIRGDSVIYIRRKFVESSLF